MDQKLKIILFAVSLYVISMGASLYFLIGNNTKKEDNVQNARSSILDYNTDCNNLPYVLMEDDNTSSYQIKSMQYSTDGICLRFRNNDVAKNSMVGLVKGDTLLARYHLSEKNDYLETDINFLPLENGEYSLTWINDTTSPLIEELDLLNQLVRGKINDKLVTFSYKENQITFRVEDFAYEYDILIDPGHGGVDGGTQNSTITEKNLNLEQSLYEKKRFEDHGLKVMLSREDTGDGLLWGSEEWNRAKMRGYALGYYGVVSKYVYSNHHNYTPNANIGGFEIIVPNLADENDLQVQKNIYRDWLNLYPESLRTNHLGMYSRDYMDGQAYDKSKFAIIDKIDWYATTRIPDQLYNVELITYEGCYLQNTKDFNWYYKEGNWKKLSEAKIKAYVEALGKTYVPEK